MSNQAGFAPLMAQPRRWEVISGFMLAQGYKTFVEIGAKEGRTTGHVLKTVPDSRVIAVDPWAPMPQQQGVVGGETYEEWDFATIEAQFWENVGENKDRCLMWRMTSKDAADYARISPPELNPGSSQFDAIFIDAAHDYANVKLDIRRWWPLVRIGGMCVGHDANHKWPGVERAFAESFCLMDVGFAPDSIWFVIKASEDQLRA